ncbi:MAG: hypothetical protein AAGC67_04975 [Myxococcota bacterium]
MKKPLAPRPAPLPRGFAIAAFFYLALFAALTLAAGEAPAQNFGACLQDDGVAYFGYSSAAVAASEAVWIFDGDPWSPSPCGPPVGGGAESLTGGSVAAANYAAGTGVILTTSALAPPTTILPSRGFLAFEASYRFRVVPDDPLATGPVEIIVTTRHRFGDDRFAATGDANASNTYRALYAVENGPIFWPGFLQDWSTDGLPIVSKGYYDLVERVTVPVDQELVFRTSFQQESFARGNVGLPTSSAAASLGSTSTFAFETDAAATIVFAVETELGLAAPQLDVVPEPATTLGFAPGLVLAAALGRRRCGPRATKARR